MRYGLLAKGLDCVAASPPTPPPRTPAGGPRTWPPVAVLELERKGVGQTSQMTLGFHGERQENKANGS